MGQVWRRLLIPTVQISLYHLKTQVSITTQSKTYLQQAVYTVAANFYVALPDLSKLLTAPWLLETVAATSLVSLSHQGPVRIVLLVWNTV